MIDGFFISLNLKPQNRSRNGIERERYLIYAEQQAKYIMPLANTYAPPSFKLYTHCDNESNISWYNDKMQSKDRLLCTRWGQWRFSKPNSTENYPKYSGMIRQESRLYTLLFLSSLYMYHSTQPEPMKKKLKLKWRCLNSTYLKKANQKILRNLVKG